MKKIPLFKFIGIMMWIWKWNQDDMFGHFYVSYWGVMECNS